jgi:hypothetical protein
MAKATWSADGNTLSYQYVENQPDFVVDISTFSQAIKVEAMRAGFQRIAREVTAGKLEEPAKALAALTARFDLFKAGKWVSEGTQKSAFELDDAEKSDVISTVIINAYKGNGDKRTGAEIIAALNAGGDAMVEQVQTMLKTQIDKALKDALAKKKKLAKTKLELPGLPA